VVVLPSLVASFLAEASKFLFYDTSICRKNVWFPPGTESLPRTAECSIGSTAIYGIASGIIFLVCLILVCLKAPNRRELEPNYGLDVENGNIGTTPPRSFFGKGHMTIPPKDISLGLDGERDRHGNISASPARGPGFYLGDEDGESGVTSINSRGYESGYDSSVNLKNFVQKEVHYDEDDLLSQQRSRSVGHTVDSDNGDKHSSLQPPATDVTIIRNRSGGKVSRSRLETVERMEKNASRISNNSADIIDELLTDLDQSFQIDSHQNEKSR